MKIFSVKKNILIAVCSLLFAFGFTQAAVDVFDPFYEDLTVWENMGLINDAPAVRPYPLQEIKRILDIVIEQGDQAQIRRATEYKNRFFGRVFHFGGLAEFGLKMPKGSKELIISPFADVNFTIAELFTASANLHVFLTNKTNKDSPHPLYLSSPYDLADDNVKAGPFFVLPMFNSGIAIGKPEYYFTAGISRTHYGPFHDSSLIAGSQAFHQGQFNFVVNKEKWTYNQSFLTLTASNDFGGAKNAGKFLNTHSLQIRPFPWLSFGIVDSIIYGQRFEPLYLIPFSVFFISQGLYDFPDNSLIGLTFTVKPIKGLKIDGILYSDDLGFNEIIKFKKDAKWRLSGQFGISYAMPETHWFTYASLDYTFVTPYTYTHVSNHDSQIRNYENYTHNGGTLGSNLHPNSDRINLKLKFRPLYGLDLDFHNTFIRHGNISESIDDIEILKDYISKKYNTDGSILNHATITKPHKQYGTFNKAHAFLFSTPFMKQQTIQYVNQLGFDLSCYFPILKSGGKIIFKAGYIFEANINPGVSNGIYSPNAAFKDWNSKTLEELAAQEGTTVQDIKNRIHNEAARQLELWRSQAVGRQFNHYIRISIRVAY